MSTTTKCLDAFFQFYWTLKLSMKSLKDGQNCGFDHSLRKFSIKSLSICCVLRLILKVGWNFGGIFFFTSQFLKKHKLRSIIGYAHGTRCPKSKIGQSKTTLNIVVSVIWYLTSLWFLFGWHFFWISEQILFLTMDGFILWPQLYLLLSTTCDEYCHGWLECGWKSTW